MNAFTPFQIRLFCDVATKGIGLDLNTGQAPFFIRGDDIEIDIGIGELGNLLTGLASGGGAGNIASVTAQLFQSEDDTNDPMMAVSVAAAAMNFGLTQTEWTNNTTPFYHAAFVFPNSVTAIDLQGAPQQSYWLRIFATTGDATPKQITLLEGDLLVKDGPISAVSSVPPAYFRLYTIAGNIVPQIYDPVSAHYYNLEIDTVGGIRTLSLGDTAY